MNQPPNNTNEKLCIWCGKPTVLLPGHLSCNPIARGEEKIVVTTHQKDTTGWDELLRKDAKGAKVIRVNVENLIDQIRKVVKGEREKAYKQGRADGIAAEAMGCHEHSEKAEQRFVENTLEAIRARFSASEYIKRNTLVDFLQQLGSTPERKGEDYSHFHCWNQGKEPACGQPLKNHKQCCLCPKKRDITNNE